MKMEWIAFVAFMVVYGFIYYHIGFETFVAVLLVQILFNLICFRGEIKDVQKKLDMIATIEWKRNS